MTELPPEVEFRAAFDDILRTTVGLAREIVGADATFAAARNDRGSYDLSVREGLAEPRWADVCLVEGRGLGGQVLAEKRPVVLEDYVAEPSITADWKPLVQAAGLRGFACVPIAGPGGTAALLYIANHEQGNPGDRAVGALQRLADIAAVGLRHAGSHVRERELAVLHERRRIAASLHDSVAQSLFSIGVTAQRSREGTDAAMLRDQIETIEVTAVRARAELRQALAELSLVPEGLAFEARLEAEVSLFQRRTGQRVWVTRHGEPRPLEPALEDVLIDSFREGLTNANKHGAGELVLAHVAYRPETVLLSVQSELRTASRAEPGPRAEPAIRAGSGLGLLRERARQLGGELSLTIHEDGTGALRIEIAG